MRFKSTGALVVLILLYLIADAFAHDTDIVHPGVTLKAKDLLPTSGYSEIRDTYLERDGDCNGIRNGSIKEDNFLSVRTSCGVMPLSWIEHAYDPMNGQGWVLGVGTAVSKAKTELQEAIDAYNSCNKERAYFQLGRVAHLLEDMTSPAHVHNDAHALGDDFETWSRISFSTYAVGTQLVEPASASATHFNDFRDHFDDLAHKTYDASSFGAVLHRSTTTPIDPGSELARMFPGQVVYVASDEEGEDYWKIANVGVYNAYASDDWWPCPNDPGYYYIENVFGKLSTALVPVEMREELMNRTSPMGPNDKTILERWAQVLFPITVDYSAGLMKYFYDKMQTEYDKLGPAKPVGLKGRAGNARARLAWDRPTQDGCGNASDDIGDYHVYYSTSSNPRSGSAATASSESAELNLTNGKVYYVCVTALDTKGNESECSDVVTVKPTNAIWVHQTGGPAGSLSDISDALGSASYGSTIMVGPGTYTESPLDLRLVTGPHELADITLRSERGPAETIITGGGGAALNVYTADKSRVIGFTISNAEKGIDALFVGDVLIANNVFVADNIGVYIGGAGAGGGSYLPVRIYNNVFAGHVGISGWLNMAESEIHNNIFYENTIGVEDRSWGGICIANNDFFDNDNAMDLDPVWEDIYVGVNSTCDPRFLGADPNQPETYFHLQARSPFTPPAGQPCGVDAGTPQLMDNDIRWEDCDGTPADLGAFGGPFAHVDNNKDGIPDCAGPTAFPAAVGVLANSAERPITFSARDPGGETLTYSVSALPAHGSLNGTGQNRSYSVEGGFVGEDVLTFKASNSVAESNEAAISITVRASNVAPVVQDLFIHADPAITFYSHLELGGSDADGDPLAFTIDSLPESGEVLVTHLPIFSLSRPEGFTGTAMLTYHASDGYQDSGIGTVTVVSDRNHAPTDMLFSSNGIEENQPGGAVVGTLKSLDPVKGDYFSYSLAEGEGSGDNALFQVVGDQLQSAAGLDYEAQSSYSVRVRSSDINGSWLEESFTFTVSDVNDAPEDITLDRMTVAENNAVGATVATLMSIDDDAGDTFSYSLVSGAGSTDNGSFQIAGNSLLAAESFDYEVKSGYTVRIRSTDAGGLWCEKVFAIVVVNGNDPPTNISLSVTRIAENRPAGTTVGILSSADPNAGNSFTYTLVEGAGSTDNASFAILGGVLKTAEILDYETRNECGIRIRSTDQSGLWYERTFTITVTNTNDAPTGILLSSSSVPEMKPVGTTVGILSTADQDAGNTFTYALVSGAGSTNNASFRIVGSSLRTLYVFNFEVRSSYQIRVRTTDQNGLRFEQQFTIAVTNVNERPTDIALSGRTVTENAPIGTLVGTLSTQDLDGVGPFVYSLVLGIGSTDNNAFEINGDQLSTAVSLDYESKNALTVRIRTTDPGGLLYEKSFSINVADVNDAPTDIALSSASVAENNSAGAVIGALSSADQDLGDTFLYSLVGGVGGTDNAAFQIVGGSLTVAMSLDYESQNVYSVRVRAADQEGLFVEKALTVTVTDVSDPPTLDAIPDLSLVEDAGTQIVTLGGITTGVGGSHPLTVTASSSNPGLIPNPTVNYASPNSVGSLSLALVANASGTAVVTVVVDDGLIVPNTVTRTFQVAVAPVNDSPVFSRGADQSVAHNGEAQVVEGWATGISPGPADEATQSLAFVVTNNNAALFAVQPGIAPNGTLTYTPATGASGDEVVTVTLHDSGGTASGGIDTSAPQSFVIALRACAYSVTPALSTVSAAGGMISIYVASEAGCTWAAQSDSSWLTITSGAGGAGAGVVTVDVAPAAGAMRSGSITIAGVTVQVDQEAQQSVPTIIAVDPPDGSIAGSGTTISATFSEDMDVATITPGSFTLSRHFGLKAIAMGCDGYHTLGLRTDGKIVAWGHNSVGQADVPGWLSGVIAVAANGGQSVALGEDGRVVAWGDNSYGQCDVPIGLSDVQAIASGSYHTVALKNDGTVVAWGYNGFGQTSVPVDLQGVTAIAAGYGHSIALKQDGTVVAWGYNSRGQATVPAGLTSVIQIAAGSTFSLALRSDGTVVAWGDNRLEQCSIPSNLAGVIAIAAGGNHAIALEDDGSVVAWGNNDTGQASVPEGLPKGIAVAAGYRHSVLVGTDGTITSWGDNTFGRRSLPGGLHGVVGIAAGWAHTAAVTSDGKAVALGYNGMEQTMVPVDLSAVAAVAAGMYHTLALKRDGTVVAWGLNNVGQITVPTGLAGVGAISTSYSHNAALRDDGTVVAWGDNKYGQCQVPPDLTDARAVAAGGGHTIALREDGTVVGWGLDNYGQATVPPGLSGVAAVAAGNSNSFALRTDGTVVAWGEGASSVPADLSDAVAIAVGGFHAIALRRDGTLASWGSNDAGQLDVPTGLSGVIAIAAGGRHTVALRNDGTVVAWGLNDCGQTMVYSPLGPLETQVEGSVEYCSGSRTASFLPLQQLETGATYDATVNGGVQSTGGVHSNADFQWTFSVP